MVETKYSPDQPRDSNGRFGSGGGSNTDTKPELTQAERDKLGLGAGGSLGRTGMGDISLTATPEMADATKAMGTSGYSAQHMVDGKFTPERQALHDEIVMKALEGIPVATGQPEYHMLGGGPGVGKSTYEKSEFSTLPEKGTAVLINSDNIKDMLPEVMASKENDPTDKSWASKAHEESSYIAKRISAAAVETGRNVLLDGTGNSGLGKLTGKIEAAQSQGYRVEGHYLTRPIDDCLDSGKRRADDPSSSSYGRLPPFDDVTKTHSTISAIFEPASKIFDKVNLYDLTTYGAPPVLIASNQDHGTMVIHDTQKYQTFVDKQYYTPTQEARDKYYGTK